MSTIEPEKTKELFGIPDTWTLGYASSSTRKTTREQMEIQLHKADKERNKRDQSKTEATYNHLFTEKWGEFCAHDDIASIDSPVAYLRALYMFAIKFDEDAEPKFKINYLRPDIIEQKIDTSSVFESLPALKLVNRVLNKRITKHEENPNNKNPLEIMSTQTRPLHFPYHHSHRQCVAVLAAKNTGLGVLDYRLHVELPISFSQASGKLIDELCKAQIKMSNLSGSQINVLTAKLAKSIDTTDNLSGAPHSVVDTSDIRDGRYSLSLFASRTHCSPSEIKQLIDLQVTQIYPSKDSYPVVEDINDSELKNIVLKHNNADAYLYTALDRLQRMIRLNRWCKISLGDLDTLVCNATFSEGSDAFITKSTLRALGVFQYLNKNYEIAAEEFAALLYRLPTHSVSGRTPLFDRVCHRKALTANLLKQEGGEVEASFASLAKGMDLGISYHSLDPILQLSQKYLGKLHQNLRTASSLYRQARIAQLFGLSPLECIELVGALGGEAFKKLLVSGKLGDENEADILHLLMALDGVMTWLRSAGLTAAQLLRMLGLLTPFARETLPTHCAEIRAMRDTTAEEPQRLAVQQLLQDVAGLSAQYVPCAMKMVNTTEQALCAEIRDGKMPLLAKLLAAAEICQTLNISSDILLKLLNTPARLKSGWKSVFELQDFYCLERFAHYSRGNARTGAEFLDYLKLASRSDNNEANTALKEFLAAEQPVNIFTATLPRERVENMQQLDWITRHLEISKSTGLTLTSLREILMLKSESSIDQWNTVAAQLLRTENV